jgi:23S rRNA (uracil1939-C5)-methyltransferase
MIRQSFNGENIAASVLDDSHRGWLHALSIRVDPLTLQGELTICSRTPQIEGLDALVMRLGQIPQLTSIHLTAQASRSSYPLDAPIIRLSGSRRMGFSLLGETFLLSPGSFFQTCAEGAQQLVRQVLHLLPEKMDRFIDLYAGAGFFSFLTASRWSSGIAVEANPSAIDDLQYRLQQGRTSVIGLTPILGRVEHLLPSLMVRSSDVVLLDPPRKGCHPEVITTLLQQRPSTILYVSCGFASFIKEAEQLIEGGYHLTAVRAVDMFPHTPHLEVVARFER